MIFLPLRKVDAAQRLIYARLDETPDRAGHVLDYASSKPEFEKWSEDMRKASGGKSLGNIRAMHQLKAAGKVEEIGYDDQAKAIEICAKIVDDDEWKKVEEGVYTGISPGGRFLKRWNDGRYMRYTAGPNEISLADIPTIPSATFTMIKADGATEERPFRTTDDGERMTDEEAVIRHLSSDIGGFEDYRALVLAQPADMVKALFPTDALMKIAEAQGLQKREFSAEERAAMAKKGEALPDGSFPIANKSDLENAIHAYGRAKDKDASKAHIIKRAKDLDATDLLPEDWEGSTKKPSSAKASEGRPSEARSAKEGDLKKALGDVGQFAALVQGLIWFVQTMSAEAAGEQDGSPLPARAIAAASELAEILVAYASEESKEAVAQLNAGLAAVPVAVMEKVGARNSKADLDRIQAIHDHAASLGADCGAMATPGSKSPGAGLGTLAKVAGDLAGARSVLRKLEGENNTLKKRIADLEKQPVAGGPVRTQVPGSSPGIERRNDTGGAQVDPEVEKKRREIEAIPDAMDRSLQLIRFAMEHPEPPRIG